MVGDTKIPLLDLLEKIVLYLDETREEEAEKIDVETSSWKLEKDQSRCF